MLCPITDTCIFDQQGFYHILSLQLVKVGLLDILVVVYGFSFKVLHFLKSLIHGNQST